MYNNRILIHVGEFGWPSCSLCRHLIMFYEMQSIVIKRWQQKSSMC